MRSEGVYNCLDNCVVGRVHVVCQGERTGSDADVCLESRRSQDPIVPADLGEVDVEEISVAKLAPDAFQFSSFLTLIKTSLNHVSSSS